MVSLRPTFVVFAVCVTLASVGFATTTPADPSGSAAGDVLAAEPPANVTYTMTVSMSSGGGAATVAIEASYPARSESEADAAEAGNYTPGWFDGERRVRTVFEQVADGTDELTAGATSSWHAETTGDATREPTHGWVTVEYTTSWHDFFGPDDDRVVVGEAFAAVLDPGDRLVVSVPAGWEPAALRGDPDRRAVGEALTEYVWTVDGGDESPSIAFDRRVVETYLTRTDGQAVGPAGGIGLALIAISIISLATRLQGISGRRD